MVLAENNSKTSSKREVTDSFPKAFFSPGALEVVVGQICNKVNSAEICSLDLSDANKKKVYRSL